MNPIGAGFGVVGNLVEARRAAWASQAMESTLAAAHFDFQASLANAVTQAVSKVGFTITPVAGTRPEKERARFLSAYPQLKHVDAYLDVYATYVGFEAPQSSTAFRPRLELSARLVSAKNHQILFQDRIIYGCVENTDEEAVLVRADDNLSFKDRGALSRLSTPPRGSSPNSSCSRSLMSFGASSRRCSSGVAKRSPLNPARSA
jgi:hypothetical protein